MRDADYVNAEVDAKYGIEEISDACARVIASQRYEGQWSLGYSFVSTGTVPEDGADLWRELFPRYYDLGPRDKAVADMLGTYLTAHAGRGPVDGWSSLWVR